MCLQYWGMTARTFFHLEGLGQEQTMQERSTVLAKDPRFEPGKIILTLGCLRVQLLKRPASGLQQG